MGGSMFQLGEAKAKEVLAAIQPETIASQSSIYPRSWGLGAISHSGVDGEHLCYNNFCYDERAGEGVDIYVIDSGINTDHEEFKGENGESRAIFRKNLVPGSKSNKDLHGHGTQVAGIAGGETVGVAKKATLIAVKVSDMEDDMEAVIEGIKWPVQEANDRKRPAVFILSLGIHTVRSPYIDDAKFEWITGVAAAVDDAVADATEAGYLCCVAAGNEGADAVDFAPARAPEAFTVGSASRYKIPNSPGSKYRGPLRRWPRSNYGPSLCLFAPGDEITTSGHKPEDEEYLHKSGTSFANPHVAGVAATFLSRALARTPPRFLTPEELGYALITTATPDIIDSNDGNSPNRFLYDNSGCQNHEGLTSDQFWGEGED